MSDADITKELGQKMLAGWRMLGSHCPMCYTVLLQEKGDTKRYCCKCKAYLVTEDEAKQHNLTITDTTDDFKSTPKPEPSVKPSLPSAPRPVLGSAANIQETIASSTPKTTSTATRAMVDEDFEAEEELSEEQIKATKQSYNNLKSMYSKLMSGSQSFLDMGMDFMTSEPKQTQARDEETSPIQSKYAIHDESDNNGDDDNDDDSLILSGDAAFDQMGDIISQSILKAGEMFEELSQDLKSGAPSLPSHLITHRDISLTPPPTTSTTSTTSTTTSYSKYSTSPPDPDDDWEYYNSRDTDINHLADRIDKIAYAKAERDFTQHSLQGWIFSSHACPFCEQILLFPPSSSMTPEEIQSDVVDKYNQTLSYNPKDERYQVLSPKLEQNEVEVDQCEFIRALCTYCGWYCIGDDEEYFPTLTHECCACAVNLKAHDTRPPPSALTKPIQQQQQLSSSTKPPTNDWSSRIQAAISQAVADQNKGSGRLEDIDVDPEDYDFHNFNGLEETTRLLGSDELKRKAAHLDTVSKQLSSALCQGEMILDEYCPDCAVPLVGVITSSEYDKISASTHANARSNAGNQGMKLHVDKYATMPKKCVACKQTWNMANQKQYRVEATPQQQKFQSQPKQQQQQQQQLTKNVSPTKPLIPTRQAPSPPLPISTRPTLPQSQQQPQQYHQPIVSQPTQPQLTISQQRSTSKATLPAIQNHLEMLCETLDIITTRIANYNQQLRTGQIPTDTLANLMEQSKQVTGAIAACEAAL